MTILKNYLRYIAIVSATIALHTFSSTAQVYGCKDPLATNYNPSATDNDGSCVYNVTNYTPPVKVDPLSSVILETSGLQWAANHLWTLNDGGSSAAIYRIDTISNTILQTVNLAGTTNVDWEDIAFDGTYFYIGDFGNNANGARTDLKIYKFPLSAIPDYAGNATVTIPAGSIEVINFTYGDQPQPPVATAANLTKFDCEAMIVDGGKIHLFSKNWVDINSTHYVINSTVAGTYVASPLETLATGYLVTAADKAPGQNVIGLLGYQNSGAGSHFMHFLSDYSGGNFFNGNKRKINLPDATVMGQAEALAFRNDTYGYISNEQFVRTVGTITLTVTQKLRSFNTANLVSQTVLASELNSFSVNNLNGTHKLSWRFNAAMKNLQVQHSVNGNTFSVLKTFTTSSSDQFYYTPSSATNFYRLAWQNASGGYQFSNVVSVKDEKKNSFVNAMLTSNGQLSFTINADAATTYAIAMATPDGKIIAQVPATSYLPGINKIQLPISNVSGSVFITAYNQQQKASKLLWVSK